MPESHPETEVLHSTPDTIFDIIGVGFGPSNLALAIAATEHNSGAASASAVNTLFLEQQSQFGWHRGMLIDDATMQVSFLKDLVTLRNPASEFSFLYYLHSKGRLVDFINCKNLFPLRVEFHDYFEWAATKVRDLVAYQHQVIAVEPVMCDGVVQYLDVVARRGGGSGDLMTYRTRNVVVSMGLEPRLPAGAVLGPRIMHNHSFLHRIEDLDPSTVNRLTVVGAGQSAAEVTAFLHSRFPRAEVCAVFSRFGYSPSDDSPFANRVFDPDAVDQFYLAPEDVKQMIMSYHANTNYSVVDLDLIEDLYRRVYQEKVLGTERLRILHASCLSEVAETESGVRITVESLVTGERVVLDSDALVYATGYRPADPIPLLGDVGRYCCRDEQGRLRVERNYRVVTAPTVCCGVYLQGGTEHTHGITSSLLSNTAIRCAEILQAVIEEQESAHTFHHEFAVSDRYSA